MHQEKSENDNVDKAQKQLYGMNLQEIHFIKSKGMDIAC